MVTLRVRQCMAFAELPRSIDPVEQPLRNFMRLARRILLRR